jgi:4,5-dihydroxyphthalate decarboxylase
MAKPKITLALKGYDRHLPLLSGRISPKEIDLVPIEVKSEDRFHERMLLERPWDASELSLSSYLMAKSRGLPFIAIPVFPRRLFTHSQLYVNSTSKCRSPRDLAGGRIGLWGGYAQSLAVWVKGDLQDEWGIGLRDAIWVTADEKTGAEFEVPPGVKVEHTSEKLEELLLGGRIEALVSSMIPQSVIKHDMAIRPLFMDSYSEELSYFQKKGFYPIMHVIAVRTEIITEHPWIAKSLFMAFDEAKALAYRYYHEDPVWSLVPGVSMRFQEQRRVMGEDIWPYGIAKNRKYLEQFMQYQVEQGLIDSVLAVEDIFARPTLET